MIVQGSRVAIRGAVAEWGKRHDQDAVALIYPQMGAPGMRTIWTFETPLEPETGDALLNRIGELRVFVTAHYDETMRLLSLERWDRGIDPDWETAERDRVEHLLRRLALRKVQEKELRLELIERWEYDGLIDLSQPGRARRIRQGQNLSDYRPLSPSPRRS